MSATISGDGASSVISQLAPTSCIMVPMLEARDAIQRKRNSSCASVAQDERTCTGCSSVGGRDNSAALGGGVSASRLESDILLIEYNKRLEIREFGGERTARRHHLPPARLRMISPR